MRLKKLLFLAIFTFATSLQADDYVAKDYSHLLGMRGFGDVLLKMHFELYQGYVKNSNMLLNLLRNFKGSNYEFSALKRRVGWEFDGMRLHELYFGNLGGSGKMDNKESPFCQQLFKDFGSYEQWKNDFVTTGLSRGIGWVILYYDMQQERLINTWIEEHDLGHLAGCVPLLVMDVWEHAYITQYGLERAKYIDAFFENIDWSIVNNRFIIKKS